MEMRSANRWEFVASGLAAAGLAPAALRAAPEPAVAVSPTRRVPLGKTGITASFVGLGTGMQGGMRASNHTRLGQEAFTRLARLAAGCGAA
jgi:hypothetical protein